MSFYAGKYNGKSQCHITQGSHSISKMRGAPGPGTVFHSDCKYLDYKVYTLTPASNSVLNNTGVTEYHGYGYPDVPCSAFYLSNEIINYISNKNHAFGVYDLSGYQTDHTGDLSLKIAPHIYPDFQGIWFSPTAVTATVARDDLSNSPDGKRYLIAKRGNKRLIIWGINVNGTFQPLTNQNRSGAIYINRTNFKIGSSNIYDIKHLSPVIYNISDITIRESVNTANKSQLVGSTNRGSGLTISSKVGRTYIKKGDNLILDSNVGSKMLDNSTSQLRSTTQKVIRCDFSGNGQRITRSLEQTIAYNIPVGAYVMLTINFSNSELQGLGNGNTSAAIFRYKNGRLQQINKISYTSYWQNYFLEMYLAGDANGTIKLKLYYNTVEKKNSGHCQLTLPAAITNTIILK